MIVFLFPGQGSQHPGMMSDIARSYACAREVFDAASSVCALDIPALCEGEGENAHKLDLTEYTQPCLAACELAALAALESHGVRADLYAGFSLGEWSASAASGALSMRDMFYLLQNRARFMQEAVPEGEGAMGAILGRSDEYVQALCNDIGKVWPSSYNCAGNVTVSGESRAIDELSRLSLREAFTFQRLKVSVPSHCPLMEPAAQRLEALMPEGMFSAPSRPFVMNADAQICRDGAALRNNLLKQLVSPMLFEKCVRKLLGEGADIFIEIGPGHTLSRLVERIAPNALILRVCDVPSLNFSLETLDAYRRTNPRSSL